MHGSGLSPRASKAGRFQMLCPPYLVAEPKEVVAQDLLYVEEHFEKNMSVSCKSVQKPTGIEVY